MGRAQHPTVATPCLYKGPAGKVSAPPFQPCSGRSVPVQPPDCPSPQTEGAVTASDEGGESEFTCTQDFGSGLASLREWGREAFWGGCSGSQRGTKWLKLPVCGGLRATATACHQLRVKALADPLMVRGSKS